ncbi:hypothetical protein TcWFU_007565 [Taenia crassiceps]|uniref:Uncharacterized protein n=1 Tax=Taenia crassiceps TaxID=6207 RepID=A0ABR4QID8_9CEST
MLNGSKLTKHRITSIPPIASTAVKPREIYPRETSLHPTLLAVLRIGGVAKERGSAPSLFPSYPAARCLAFCCPVWVVLRRIIVYFWLGMTNLTRSFHNLATEMGSVRNTGVCGANELAQASMITARHHGEVYRQLRRYGPRRF